MFTVLTDKFILNFLNTWSPKQKTPFNVIMRHTNKNTKALCINIIVYFGRVVSLMTTSNWLWNRKQPQSGVSRWMSESNTPLTKPEASTWLLI